MTNVIVLKGDPIRKEGVANGSITPGELLMWASGSLDQHGTANGNAQPRFAVEEDFVGDGIDDAYADNDQVQYVVGRKGDEIYALLADGQSVSKGDPLASDGTGALQSITIDATTLAGAVVAYAAEDKTASGARARIIVEVA